MYNIQIVLDTGQLFFMLIFFFIAWVLNEFCWWIKKDLVRSTSTQTTIFLYIYVVVSWKNSSYPQETKFLVLALTQCGKAGIGRRFIAVCLFSNSILTSSYRRWCVHISTEVHSIVLSIRWRVLSQVAVPQPGLSPICAMVALDANTTPTVKLKSVCAWLRAWNLVVTRDQSL